MSQSPFVASKPSGNDARCVIENVGGSENLGSDFFSVAPLAKLYPHLQNRGSAPASMSNTIQI